MQGRQAATQAGRQSGSQAERQVGSQARRQAGGLTLHQALKEPNKLLLIHLEIKTKWVSQKQRNKQEERRGIRDVYVWGGRKQKKYNARMRLEDKEENYWRHARTFCNPLASLALRVRAVSFIRSICLICFVCLAKQFWQSCHGCGIVIP